MTESEIKEMQCAFHHLKAAVAAIEICGVPIHHLSHELAKHFSVPTHDFVKEMQVKSIKHNCEFLNERARYKRLCEILLSHTGFTDAFSLSIIERAKKGELKFIEDVLEEMRSNS